MSPNSKLGTLVAKSYAGYNKMWVSLVICKIYIGVLGANAVCM